jgi:hypothetical protein
MWMIHGRQSGMTSVLAQAWSFERMETMRLGLQYDSGPMIVGRGGCSIASRASNECEPLHLPLVPKFPEHFLGGEVEVDLGGGQPVMAQESFGSLPTRRAGLLRPYWDVTLYVFHYEH